MTRFAILLATLPLLILSPAPLLSSAPAASPVVTPPKEHFGFNIGDDYCLANYKQLQSYWEKLAKESDRIKVVSIGKSEEGRDQLMAIVTSISTRCGPAISISSRCRLLSTRRSAPISRR